MLLIYKFKTNNMILNFLSKKHYMYLSTIMFALLVISFLSIENVIHPIFKHLSFLLLVIFSIYFIPFQLLKKDENINKINEIILKVLLGISSAFFSISSLIQIEPVKYFGVIISIFIGIFTLYLIFNKKQNETNEIIYSTVFLGFIFSFVINFFYY